MKGKYDITKQLQTQARQGKAVAQYQLALAYEKGDGVPQNNTEAFDWMKKAAFGGFGQALCQLGVYFMKGIGTEIIDTTAVYYFSQAAQKDIPEGNYYMGICYERGFGVNSSLDTALMFYERAAKEGLNEAIAAINRLSYLGKTEVLTSERSPMLTIEEWREFSELPKSLQLIYEQYFISYPKWGFDKIKNELTNFFPTRSPEEYTNASNTISYILSLRNINSSDVRKAEFLDEMMDDKEKAFPYMELAAEKGNRDARMWLSSYYRSSDKQKADYWGSMSSRQRDAYWVLESCLDEDIAYPPITLLNAKQYFMSASELNETQRQHVIEVLDAKEKELMTEEEFGIYNALSIEAKEYSKELKTRHPEWSMLACLKVARNKYHPELSPKDFTEGQKNNIEELSESGKIFFNSLMKMHPTWGYSSLYTATKNFQKAKDLSGQDENSLLDLYTTINGIKVDGNPSELSKKTIRFTTEDLLTYQKLNEEQKETFLFFSSRHKEWTFQQLLALIAVGEGLNSNII